MITCIGEILVDQFKDEKGISSNLGGAPFNVAVSIKRSGGHSSFVGAVGNDDSGRFVIEEAKKQQLDNLKIDVLDEYDTTIALVELKDGERSFKFIRSNGADYHISEDLPPFVYESNIVHIGSLMLSEPCGREFIQRIIPKLKAKGILISFDINYREDIFDENDDIQGIFKSVIEQADILKISSEELDIFSNEYIDNLRDKLVCLSLGSKGSVYCYNGMRGFVTTTKVKPVDTTGAGDAFYGAVLSQIDGYQLNELTKDQLDKAFRFANIVGALTTLGKGAINPIPYKEEISKTFFK
ncbi:MAG: carbohydrate kinase [Bacilli bacterium]|nr:carbohydrate kinase [Bacilli bacterium]